MACWGSPVSSSANIKDEWALADIFVSDSNTHKALLNIVLVLLLCAGLTGAQASPQCTVWQHRRLAGLAGVGLWFTSASVQPTMETLSKTNICLAKVKALSVCLPSRWLFLLFHGSFGQDILQDPSRSDFHPPPPSYTPSLEPNVWIMMTKAGKKNTAK